MDLEVHYLSKAKSKAEDRSKELANNIAKQQVYCHMVGFCKVVNLINEY
jgi:hypothetical protein